MDNQGSSEINLFLKIKYFLFIIGCFFIRDLYALGIRQALIASTTNNYQLMIARENIKKEIFITSEIMSEFFPNAEFKLQKDKKFLFKNKSMHIDQAYGYLNIEYKLFNGFTTIQKILSRNHYIKFCYQDYHGLLNETFFNILDSYQRAIALKKMIKINEDDILIAKKYLIKLKRAVECNSYNISNVYLAQAELAQVYSEKEKNTAQLIYIKNHLKYLTGLQFLHSMMPIDIFHGKNHIHYQSFITTVMQNNHSIKARYYLSLYQKSQIRISQSRLLPIIRIILNTSKFFGLHDRNRRDLSEYNTDAVSLSVNIPLFDQGGMQYLDIIKTKKLYRMGQLEFQNLKLRIHNEARSTWGHYTSSEYILQQSINTQNNYYKRYYALMKEHTLGVQTIMNIMQAQRDHNNASMQMIKHEMVYKTYLFTLHKLMGSFSNIDVVKVY